MIKKNDILDLTIEDLGVNGEGIGKVDGYTLFVKDGVIGDKVTVKVMKANKNFGFARLMEIKELLKIGFRQDAVWQDSVADAKFSALITRSSLDLRRIKCTTTLCELVVRATS